MSFDAILPSGQYKLNWLDCNGQRINITIKIPRRDKSGEATFTSGWMVYPNGKIQHLTPYAEELYERNGYS